MVHYTDILTLAKDNPEGEAVLVDGLSGSNTLGDVAIEDGVSKLGIETSMSGGLP